MTSAVPPTLLPPPPDAGTDEVALLDLEGRVLSASATWERTAREPGALAVPPGGSYLRAFEQGGASAAGVLLGLRGVMSGGVPHFQADVTHRVAGAPRRLRLVAMPLGSPPTRVLVMHAPVDEGPAPAAPVAPEGEAGAPGRVATELGDLAYLQRAPAARPLRPGEQPRPAAQGLRRDMPALFEQLVGEYAALLDLALERQAYRDQERDPSEGLRAIAEQLSGFFFRPRDVVELHAEALRRRTQGAPPARAAALMAEGRLMALELMGHLAAAYRTLALVAPRGGPDRGGDTGGGADPTPRWRRHGD